MEEPFEEILAEEETIPTVKDTFSVSSIFENYGWIILLGTFSVYLAWIKYFRPKYEEYKSRRQSERESAEHHKDPDISFSRMQGLEAARQRMQSQHDAKVAEHLDKTRQEEERKRQEKIDDWEQHQQGLGYRRKTKVQDTAECSSPITSSSNKPKARLRQNDYNPLLGNGGSGGFRSSRRGQGGGGG